MNNRKKILVLGGAFQHCKVVDAAHELGLTVYVTDYLMDSPAKEFADVRLMYDIKDVDEIVEYCKSEKIDGVISTSLDPCQIPYQEICENLSLPCFGNRKQFFQLTNKQAFKKLCGQYEVDTIISYEIKDLKQSDFPIMIKPEDSRGSRGQTICYDVETVHEAVKCAASESSTGNVIIEKYMEGAPDFAAAYLVVNGKAHLVRTCDRYTGEIEDELNRVAIAACSPSKYTQMYLDNVNGQVIAMLEGMGIQNGPVFMQGLVDGETVRFYDPGFRFSGGEYERLFKLATGVDLIKALVIFSVTGQMDSCIIPESSVFLNGKRILHLDPALRSGKIAKIKGKEIIQNQEKVITFFARYEEGEVVPNCADVSRRYAEICTLTDSKDEEAELIRFIQCNISILDEYGNQLICSPLSSDIL